MGGRVSGKIRGLGCRVSGNIFFKNYGRWGVLEFPPSLLKSSQEFLNSLLNGRWGVLWVALDVELAWDVFSEALGWRCIEVGAVFFFFLMRCFRFFFGVLEWKEYGKSRFCRFCALENGCKHTYFGTLGIWSSRLLGTIALLKLEMLACSGSQHNRGNASWNQMA